MEPVRWGPRPCRTSRLSSFTLAITLLLALPAVGHASDPLLSGYGGPGGGQQVLLGSHLIDRGGPGASPAPAASLRAPVPPADATGTGSSSQGTASSSKGTAVQTPRHGSRHRSGARRAAGSHRGAPVVREVAYPTRSDDGAGFPLAAGEILVAVLALLAVGGMGAWLRRTATASGGEGAQAPS